MGHADQVGVVGRAEHSGEQSEDTYAGEMSQTKQQ